MFRAVVFAALFAVSSQAAILDLTGNNVSWNGIGASPVMTVGLDNADSPDLERMLGWQITLQIVPQGGAVGSVSFATPASSPPFATPPAGYVLAGQSAGIISINTGNMLRLADDDPTLVGVIVPPTGATLMDITYAAAPLTAGFFDIFVVNGIANASWSDDNFNDRQFNNVPFAGPSLLLATVEVVPEPSGLWLVGALVPGAAVFLARRRRLARIAK